MIVESTEYSSNYPVENVQILGSEDVGSPWLAQHNKTKGEGFTMRLDYCKRIIVGIQIKNTGKGGGDRLTDEFRVSGSVNETGPWKTLVEAHLADTTGGVNAPLVNFTFVEPVEIQYIKFELVSFWGGRGGGLQYFAAIPATSKCLPFGIVDLK